MILDDQRPLVPKWAREVFSDERALKYVDGIGIHWYADEIFVVPFALDQAHEEFPDKFLLYTGRNIPFLHKKSFAFIGVLILNAT